MPAARQNRSKLADTSSQALPTAPIFVDGNTVGVVLILFMALLSFRGITTPSLPAQSEQRRFSYFNIQRDIPCHRNPIVKEAWIFHVPARVVDVLLVERPADALRHAALDLPLDVLS